MKLKDVATIKHGFPYKGEYFTDVPTKNILLTPTNFTLKGGFQYANRYYSNEGEMPEEFILHKDDLIVTMTDLSKEIDTIGYGALIPDDPNHVFLHNQRIGLVTIFNPIVDKYYLYWLMRTKFYQRTIAGASNGATVHHTSPDRILSFNWIFPSLDNQKKIASILSAYDSQIENNKKRIKLLEQMAENLYKEWFVRFRFPGYETAEFEGGVPKGWRIEKLGNVANIRTGKCNREDAEEGGIFPLFDRSQEVKKSNTWLMDCEAIIVPGEGTSFTPRYYEGKFNLHQRCYCVEPRQKGTGKFLFYMLMFNKAYFLSVATGATVPSLRQNNFTKMKFIMPSFDLCRQYDKHISLFFAEIDSLSKQVETLTHQRDLLLPRLMSGKLSI